MDHDADLVGSTEKHLAAKNTLWSTAVLAVIAGSIAACGWILGGQFGLAVGIALGVTFVVCFWWFSDRLVIRASGARLIGGAPIDGMHTMLTDLSLRAGIPTPRCYLIQIPQPNAFAVGHSPKQAAIVVTEGLLSLLQPAEVRAVLALELVHIRRRDTVTTTLVGAALSVIFGVVELVGVSPTRGHGDSMSPEPVPATDTLLSICPLRRAQRSRQESDADRDGSDLAGNAEALARALARIDLYAQVVPMERRLAHVSNWVVNPLGDREDRAWLFATSTPLAERIDRLRCAHPQRVPT
jgi:heat shock protein HtpX